MIHSLQFRQKIWLLPFSAATVFAVGVAVSFFVGAGTSASLRYLETVASPTHSLVQKVDGGIESIRLMLQAAVAEGDVEKVDEVQVAVDKTRSLIKELATIAASRPLADRISRGFERYQGTALGATRAMLSKGDLGDQINGMRLAQQALHQDMETATRESAAAVAESQQAAGRGTRLAQWASLATGLVTLLVLGVASVAVVRSVWQDLGEEPGKLKDLVREIASGNLTVAPAIVEGDTRSLNSALGQMLHQLRDAVTTIHLAADSIGTSSAEIAQGSADLSHRTEAAASNLQLTASSVEGLTGSVHQSSLAASQANDLAVTAATAAKNGGEIMTQVVTNMTEIDVASRRIAEIIGVIDGIAFQTNILALNAAVEAARAGDQGRGFAVVAGEVRSLARRSAEAAREIRDLIGGSVEKVAFGTRLVGSAGSAMQDIVGSVSRVSSVVGEISCSAQVQSNGIGQVNHAVMALDKMTQQNAALVEQSTAAAESMREQSVRLTEAVAKFRVPELSVLAHCA